MSDYLSFQLKKEFVDSFRDTPVDWGYVDAAGSAVSEIVFLRTYSRIKEDGTKETWDDVCERVINGMFSLQKDHAHANRLPWSDVKAHRSAEEAYRRMREFKWSPPGRGLWTMGTPLVNRDRNSAALNNCAFVSTKDMPRNNPADPFCWLMEASTLGIGVGFDTLGSEKEIQIREPKKVYDVYVIPDTREGWVESVRLLLNAYLDGGALPAFSYGEIRPAGAPIKTFGGTAAGPDPLMKLHDKLAELFKRNMGGYLDSLMIMDIANLIGVCVVSGNVRRSAELAVGQLDDANFLSAKDPDQHPYRSEWGWMSNNSVAVNVGDDLSGIAEGVALNGEPGVMWMDTTRNYGRLADAPDYKDYRVAGYNPCCFSGETLVQTVNGPMRIDEMNTPTWVVVNGKAYRSTASWFNGVKDVFTLKTTQGYELSVTEDHKVQKSDGAWTEVRDLVPGDSLVLNNHRGVGSWHGEGTRSEGYLLGALKGDGHVAPTHVYAEVWEKDDGFQSLYDTILSHAEQVRPDNRRTDWSGWRDHGRGYRVMSLDKPLVERYGMLSGAKPMTDKLEKTSSDFQAGFLQGIFDADGHIEGWEDTRDYKGVSVRLSQSSWNDLLVIQRMLLRFGIKSKIYSAAPARYQSLPDGKGGDKDYWCKESYRLVISSDDVREFYNYIGFSHSVKQEKLSKVMAMRKFYTKPFSATVESLDFRDTEDVYDLTVDDVHAVDANGLVAHNCEQSLESYEMCTLVETYLNNHSSVEDFKQTLKFAYLYAKTVTLLPTHWEKTNAIMQRNRRIGASVSGVANFADNRGMPALRKMMDEGYGAVQEYDRKYSEWLCVRESVKTTTCKPSGTVSLLSGSSPGVHWAPGGQYHLRGVVFQKDDPMVDLFRQAGYTVQESAYTPETSVFIQFPIKSQAQRSEHDVTIFEKINLAAEAQKYWSDNAVSVTVSFDKEREAQYVPTVLDMYEGKLKTVSFLPQGNETYAQMPYQSLTPEQYEDMRQDLLTVDLSSAYGGAALDAEGESGCTTDACEINSIRNESN